MRISFVLNNYQRNVQNSLVYTVVNIIRSNLCSTQFDWLWAMDHVNFRIFFQLNKNVTNSIRSPIIENILKRSKQNMCRLIWEFHLLQDFQMRLAFNYFRQLIVSLNWYVFIQLSIQFWLFLFAFNWSKVQRLCNWRIGWVWRYLD